MSQVPAGAHNLHHLFGKYTQMLQGDLSPSHWPALIECYERIMTIAPAFCPAYCVLLHAKRRISDQLLAKAVALIRTPHGQTRNRDVDRSAPAELTPQKISCTLPLAPLAALGAKRHTVSRRFCQASLCLCTGPHPVAHVPLSRGSAIERSQT